MIVISGPVRFPAAASGIYHQSVTIDHTKVPSTQTNFTVLVSVTDVLLKSVSNGGHVARTDAFDLGFYSDSGGTTKLKWEVEKYVATTGQLIAWVKIASVSSASDTVFYMFYGDTGITTDQSDAANTWDSNFVCVWHMADNAASTTILKSTSTGANGANVANTSGKQGTGKIGVGLTYNGTTDGSSAAVNLSATAVVTLSAWVNWTTNANDDDLLFEYTANFNSAGAGFIVDWNDSGTKFLFGSGAGDSTYWTDTFTRPSAGSLHLVHLVMDKSLSAFNKGYVDGSVQSLTTGTHSLSGSSNYANSSLYFMSRAAASLNAAGTMDEVRISNVERSQDWITCEYNSQNAPGTFITMGSEV